MKSFLRIAPRGRSRFFYPRQAHRSLRWIGLLLGLTLQLGKAWTWPGGSAVYGQTEQVYPDLGWREICRIDVSGLYLARYDRYRRLNDSLRTLAIRQQRYEKALKEARKTERIWTKKRAQEEFNTQTIQTHEAAKARAELLANQLKDIRALLKSAGDSVEEAKKHKQNLLKSLQSVFKLVEKRNDRQGYPWQLAYLSSCPPLRIQCPLPSEEAKALGTLLGADTPKACKAYSKIR